MTLDDNSFICYFWVGDENAEKSKKKKRNRSVPHYDSRDRPADQRRYAAMLKQAGASMRAIQRLTGLSMGILARCNNYE